MIGKTQREVLRWLKAHPSSTVSEVGDACYHISYYGSRGGCALPEHKRFRSRWASRVLQSLKKKGLAYYENINDPHWSAKIQEVDTSKFQKRIQPPDYILASPRDDEVPMILASCDEQNLDDLKVIQRNGEYIYKRIGGVK